jgi:branched-subunit amino acid transport protein
MTAKRVVSLVMLLVAAAVAALIAWWRKNTVETIVVGMTTLWLTRWLVG